MANRRALTDEQEAQLARDYENGDGQTILARRYGVGQVTVRAALARQGVKQRSLGEANAPKADPAEIVRLYRDEGLKTEEVAARLGVSEATVLKFTQRAGASRPKRVRYRFDRAFFDEVDDTRAYWAGFIAADGCITGNSVNIGLAKKDRGHLELLQKAAQLEQPIREHKTTQGHDAVYLGVTCPEWVAALRDTYALRGVPGGKAVNLVGPPRLAAAMRLPFLRGFFDGDGSADPSGAVIFTTASSAFSLWIQSVFGPPSRIYDQSWTDSRGAVHPAFQLRYGIRDATAPLVARLLYAGSTPETRLARKHARLLRWLSPA
jgi:transposase